MNIPKVIYLLVAPLWTTLLSVEAKVTFYYDRDEWLAALGDANIVQNIARRSIKNPQTWNERAENQRLPFQQCDLTFLPDDTCEGCSHKDWMQIWNYQLPEIASFNNNDAYSFRVGGNFAQNRKIEAAHPFYAVGFDHVSKGQGNKFTIKVLDDETREYTSNLANRGQKAKFYGWITDQPEEDTKMFEISHANNDVIHFMYTNIAYATYDDSAVTQVGCYITDAATRSCSATGWGDPHFSTFDNYMYDVHVKGEVTLAKSMNTTFEIQGRLEGVGQTTLGGPAVTTGVVVREKTPDLPRMQVSVASSSSETATRFNISRVDHVTGEIEYHECPVELFVDGVPKDMSIGTGRSDARAGVIGNKVVVEYPSTNLRLDMRVNYFRKCLFSVDYLLADCRPQETLIGVLGSPDEKWSNDWMTRDGTVLKLPEDTTDGKYFQPAYEYVVDNWCIRDPATSLFTYEGGENFYTYAHCGNAYDPTLEDVVAAGTSVELSMCEEDDLGCKIEVLTLGTEAAEAYLEDPAHDLTYTPTKAPTTPPTPYPTPEPTISPTPGPTSNPTPTPGPTSQPTPGPTLLDQSRAEDINGCPIPSKDITVGSEFGKKCGHKGIGLVTTSPRELLTFKGDNFLESSSLNDIFYDIRTSDSQVSFQAKNPFDDKVDMYVRYEAEYEANDHTIGHPRFTTCEATPDVERCDTLDVGPLEAGCVANHKTGESYAVVDVYFVDKSNSLFPFEIESSTTVDECCHPTGTEGATVALYSFFIMCTCPSFNPDGNVDVRTDGTDDVVGDDDTKSFAVAAIDTQPPTPPPTLAPTPSPTPAPITDFPSLSPTMVAN